MKTLFKENNYKYTQDGNENFIKVWKYKTSAWNHAYTVLIDDQGFLKCSCPGFKYHNKQCKHVDKTATLMKEFDITIETIPTEHKVKRHEVHMSIETLMQWIYIEQKKLNQQDAINLINDLEKERPKAPWIDKEIPLEVYNIFKTQLEERLEIIENELSHMAMC